MSARNGLRMRCNKFSKEAARVASPASFVRAANLGSKDEVKLLHRVGGGLRSASRRRGTEVLHRVLVRASSCDQTRRIPHSGQAAYSGISL